MDTVREDFHHARRLMFDAFADLLEEARRAGVAYDPLSEIQGRFFDGNVEIKRAFRVAVILAEVRGPSGAGDGSDEE